MAKTRKAEEVTFDRIRAWLNQADAEELSSSDKLIYDRWDYAYDQLKLEKPSAVVNRLMGKFDVSKSQAYIDIRNCQKLLNPINRHDLEWIRNFIVEDALLQIKVSRDRLDQKSWQKARTDLIKIYALEREQKQGIDPELLGRNEYFIAVNFGDKTEKINLEELHKLPLNKRLELTDSLFNEIEAQDAKFILES